MDALKLMQDYFQTGTAEGDDHFLEDAFLRPDSFSDVISVSPGAPRIIVGKKGSGKSAILRIIKKKFDQIGLPCILITPSKLEIGQEIGSALAPLTRAYQKEIVRLIAIELGRGKFFAENTDAAKLVGLANDSGEREPDFIERLKSLLIPFGKSFGNIDFTPLTSTDANAAENIISAVKRSLKKESKGFFVLIDDTDQVADLDQPNQLNKIWAFLLAAREIMLELSNSRFVISLRDEIWRRMNHEKTGQRDQVDHFRNCVIQISHSEEMVSNIVFKRLLIASEELNLGNVDIYGNFFEGKYVLIPTTNDEYRNWSDFISKRSRNRPRDAIQLVFLLAKNAITAKSLKIKSEHAPKAMILYSRERTDDLSKEYYEECHSLDSIVRHFATAKYDTKSFTLLPDEAFRVMKDIPSRFSVILNGATVRASDSASVFRLWKFLYDIGFLNGRVSDSRKEKGYDHIDPNEDPNLVSVERWNDIQKVAWEINPAYRDFLIDIQQESRFNTGLPPISNNRAKKTHR